MTFVLTAAGETPAPRAWPERWATGRPILKPFIAIASFSSGGSGGSRAT
jgi:hypothetical protein